MIPETRHRLLSNLRVLKAISIEVEHSKLISVHDVARWLCLNSTPDVPNGLFEYRSDRRVNMAFFIVPDNLQGSCYRELACADGLTRRLTHVNFCLDCFDLNLLEAGYYGRCI